MPLGTHRATRNGRHSDYSQDRASEVRLYWALHALTHALEVDANCSTIIRRALQHYQHHVEDVLDAGPNSTLAMIERTRIAEANRGAPLGISKEQALVLPVANLSAIRAAHLRAHPAKLARMRDRGEILPAATVAALAKAYDEATK